MANCERLRKTANAYCLSACLLDWLCVCMCAFASVCPCVEKPKAESASDLALSILLAGLGLNVSPLLCLCLASLGHLSQPVSAFALDIPRYPRGRCRPFLCVSQHDAKHAMRQQRKSASDCWRVLIPCFKMFSAMHEPESIIFSKLCCPSGNIASR